MRRKDSPVSLPFLPPCQQPDAGSPARRSDKGSERSPGPCESQHNVSHAYEHDHKSSNIQRGATNKIQRDLLVVRILHRSCADRLEVKDVIFFGCRGAYKARGEDGFADIGVGTKDLMHAEMLE